MNRKYSALNGNKSAHGENKKKKRNNKRGLKTQRVFVGSTPGRKRNEAIIIERRAVREHRKKSTMVTDPFPTRGALIFFGRPQFPIHRQQLPVRSRYFFHSSHYNRLVAVRFPQSIGKPLETFVQTVTSGSAGGLDELEQHK